MGNGEWANVMKVIFDFYIFNFTFYFLIPLHLRLLIGSANRRMKKGILFNSGAIPVAVNPHSFGVSNQLNNHC
jgi:hypothetical protein